MEPESTVLIITHCLGKSPNGKAMWDLEWCDFKRHQDCCITEKKSKPTGENLQTTLREKQKTDQQYFILKWDSFELTMNLKYLKD